MWNCCRDARQGPFCPQRAFRKPNTFSDQNTFWDTFAYIVSIFAFGSLRDIYIITVSYPNIIIYLTSQEPGASGFPLTIPDLRSCKWSGPAMTWPRIVTKFVVQMEFFYDSSLMFISIFQFPYSYNYIYIFIWNCFCHIICMYYCI
jgi:hypothetical protein